MTLIAAPPRNAPLGRDELSGESSTFASIARLVATFCGTREVYLYQSDSGQLHLVAASSRGTPPDELALLAKQALSAGESITSALGALSVCAMPVATADPLDLVLVFAAESDVSQQYALVRGLGPSVAEITPGFMAACKDVRSLATELQVSRDRYRKLSEAVSSGVAVIGTDGRLQEVNEVAADILGETPATLVGRKFHDFVAPEDIQLAEEEFRTRLAGDFGRRDKELRVLRASGERRLLQSSSSVIVDANGIAGVFFAGRDITDERARDAQLRRAERLASVAPLLSGVCHELNNPLTSIKSFAELLLLDERASDDVEALQIIQREAERAGRIVSDLRMVARQSQDEASTAAPLDLCALTRERCAARAADFEAAGVSLHLNLRGSLPAVYGVRSQIERVVDQLLTNAIHAMRDASERTIWIRSSDCDLGIALEIKDSGRGIAPEHVERIFDPFWSTRECGEGTGLGLSLAHSIISDHHGRIEVEGGWGTGATFTLELPRAEQAERPGNGSTVKAPAKRSLRLLIVDDEAPIRYSLGRYMERRGHKVMDAARAEEALSIVQTEGAFDLVLADLRMPGIGGIELLHRMRALVDGIEERLIFITGDSDSPDVAGTLQALDVTVVHKPFELAEIAQIIESQASVIG